MAEDKIKGTGSALAGSVLMKLLANPYVLAVLLGLFIIAFIVFFVMLSAQKSESDRQINQNSNMFLSPMSCTYVDVVNDTDWRNTYINRFADKGSLSDFGEVYLDTAIEHNIDPVLFASITFHETGHGTSNLLVNNNNPGGLYNSSMGNFFSYPSLEEGIDAMASNLSRNYYAMGLVTIEDIGNKYAPLGVANDPTNLNANWIPRITDFTNDMGGLVTNCELINFGNGAFAHPIPNAPITSPFGYRIHPLEGIPKLHKGIDYGCSSGDAIFSANEGQVITVLNGCPIGDFTCGGGYGNHVIISHGSEFTAYAHLTEATVTTGQVVERSEPIGTCGTTGSSTGPHLHFEVQLSLYGNHVDPAPYVNNAIEGGE